MDFTLYFIQGNKYNLKNRLNNWNIAKNRCIHKLIKQRVISIEVLFLQTLEEEKECTKDFT